MPARLPLLLLLLALAGCQGRTLEAYPEQLAGIGIILQSDSNGHVIQKVVTGGPAQSAGLAPGDRILSVDGKDTRGRNLASVVDQLRGKEGSSVLLRVDGRDGVEMVSVTRRALARAGGARSYETN